MPDPHFGLSVRESRYRAEKKAASVSIKGRRRQHGVRCRRRQHGVRYPTFGVADYAGILSTV